MKKLPQRTLQYNIQLVKYENPRQKDCFDLTTIHSLLIDQNPKFIQLRQLVVDYNSKQANRQVNRPHLQRPFIQRLYRMLSQLTRIVHTQNQLKFLNKIYYWAFQEKTQGPQEQGLDSFDKQRPGTASTKTRPYSAYTKKTRPDSGVPTKQSIPSKNSIQSETIKKKVLQKYENVDFKALKHGQKQFFLGYRTIHPEQEKPKVRLKQYQRKVFYDEPDEEDKFKEFIEEKKELFIQPKLQQIPVVQEEIIPPPEQPKQGEENLEQQNAGQEAVEGQQGAVPGQQDVNVDDLAAGEEDPGGVAEEQESEPVDKLRPRVKVYGDSLKPISRTQMPEYHRGLEKQFVEKNKVSRQVEQDKVMLQMMQLWAATKNRVKIEQRRRAESARITTKNPGMAFEKYTKKQEENDNGAQIFDLSQPKIAELKVDTRPISAFPAPSKRVYNENIKNALIVGQLNKHVTIQPNGEVADLSDRLCTFAAKPKKKTFQQILRQAEDRVNQQTLQQIQQVKQKLSNNRIALGANKIYKSLSHHEPEVYDGQFVGQITGKSMLNNPFFKVAKKKKKKKKK